MPDEPIGAALDRSLLNHQAPGERAEHEIDGFIERRIQKRVQEEGDERAEEMAWRESVRRHNAKRDARLRVQWSEYHFEQARRHKANLEALVAHHEEQAKALHHQPPKGAA